MSRIRVPTGKKCMTGWDLTCWWLVLPMKPQLKSSHHLASPKIDLSYWILPIMDPGLVILAWRRYSEQNWARRLRKYMKGFFIFSLHHKVVYLFEINLARPLPWCSGHGWEVLSWIGWVSLKTLSLTQVMSDACLSAGLRQWGCEFKSRPEINLWMVVICFSIGRK